MSVSYVLGENPFIYVPTPTGLPNAAGFFVTTDTVTGAPKPVYLDQAGLNPAPNPIPLNAAGITNYPIYWKVDTAGDLYTLNILDYTGQLLYSIPNYPTGGSGGGGSITILNDVQNYGRNEQFTFWSNATTFADADLPVGITEIADDWFYIRGTTNATLSISRYTYNAGANIVPFSPPYALLYTVTGGGADPNANFISQTYENVQTFNDQQITASIYAYALNFGGSSVINLILIQNFGDGGSAEFKSTIATYNTTDVPLQYSTTFTVPSVGGKTIGPGSYVRLIYQPDSTIIQQTILADYSLQAGEGTGINYPYVTINEQFVKILPDELAGHAPTQGTSLIGMSISEDVNALVSQQTLQEYLDIQAEFGTQDNVLIGWDFLTNPRQLGTTMASIANATYIADQTILLSDGNGVVSQSSVMGAPLTLTINTANKKFGIFQIIEDLNCVSLRDQIVSLSSVVTTSSANHVFKMVVLSSATSSLTVPRNAVSSWNSAGTNPSLNAAWSYATDIAEFTPDTALLNFNTLNAQELAINSSYGVLIWCDSADMAASATVRFWNSALVKNEVAALSPNEDIETVLLQCRRYIYRTYDLGTADGTITGINSFSLPSTATSTAGTFPISSGLAFNVITGSKTESVLLPVNMYKAPTVVFYNGVTGASGSANLVFPLGAVPTGGTITVTVSALSSTENHFLVAIGAGLAQFAAAGTLPYAPSAFFEFVCTALLGV